jgi:hypothetical protein
LIDYENTAFCIPEVSANIFGSEFSSGGERVGTTEKWVLSVFIGF